MNNAVGEPRMDGVRPGRLRLGALLVIVLSALGVGAGADVCPQTAPTPHPPPPTPTVPPPPAAIPFTVSCRTVRCSFTASTFGTPAEAGIQSYAWTFGDGSPTGGGGFVVHEYATAQPAQYQVSLTVRLDSGQLAGPFALTVAVNPSALRADWVYTSDYGVTPDGDPMGLVIRFFGPALTDPRYQYSWDFGDGTPPTPPTRNPIHAFASPGARTVTLSLVDRTTGVPAPEPGSVFARTIPILNAAPVAAFPTPACPTLSCTFEAGPSTDDGPTTSLGYSWDFGDGILADGKTVTHPYLAGHAYAVTLTVRDAFGGIGSKSGLATVPDQVPHADFEFVCSGLTCSLDAAPSTDDNEIVATQFDFDDGSPALPGPFVGSKTFPHPGRFLVGARVTDAAGQTARTTRAIAVSADAPTAGLSFVPAGPCRILDTRARDGGGPLTSGVARSLAIAPHEVCGIPPAARAIALNATVVADRSGGPGFVQLYPFGQSAAEISTVNFSPDRGPRGNNTIVGLQEGRATALGYSSGGGPIDLVLDVTGFFTDRPDEYRAASGFQSLPPCRVLDTRLQPPALTAGVPRVVSLASASCGVPSSARGASMNLAVASASGEGGIRAYPANIPVPLASALNFRPPGVPLANGLLAGLAIGTAQLGLVLDAAQTAQVVVDVSGYFDGSAPLAYHPIRPCRAVDTRQSDWGERRLVSGERTDVQVRGNCGVPMGAQAAMINLTVVAPDGEGFVAAFPSDLASAPTISTINFTSGETAIGNGAVVALSLSNSRDLALHPFLATGGAHLVIDILGYFAPKDSSVDRAAAAGDAEEKP